MVHVIYDVTQPPGYIEVSARLQGGSGYFKGMRFQSGLGRTQQRGRGIGGVIMRALKYLGPYASKYITPLAKDALKAVRAEGITAGQKILGDLAEGKQVAEVLKSQGRASAKNLIKKAGITLQEQTGSGRRRLKKKPKAIAAKKSKMANLHLVGRSVLESAARHGRPVDNYGLW